MFFLCVCVFDMYCMCLKLSSEFVLWNSSWTKWPIESKELLCSILQPLVTIKGIMVRNSPCHPPWLTWNFWMSTQWQFVGFCVSRTSSQKVFENNQIRQRQHGTYLALIPLMNFDMGALMWNPTFDFCCATLVFGRVTHFPTDPSEGEREWLKKTTQKCWNPVIWTSTLQQSDWVGRKDMCVCLTFIVKPPNPIIYHHVPPFSL